VIAPIVEPPQDYIVFFKVVGFMGQIYTWRIKDLLENLLDG